MGAATEDINKHPEESLDYSKEGVIKEWFSYDETTGEIKWKEWVSPAWYKRRGFYNNFMQRRAGKPVEFYVHCKGPLYTSAGGLTKIYAHHIAWVLTYGKMPDNLIDHIDGCPQNNAIENLREVSPSINSRNQKMRSDNSSGVTGVHWRKREKKWYAHITAGGVDKYLGIYDTVEEAAKARKKFLDENTDLGYTKRHGK